MNARSEAKYCLGIELKRERKRKMIVMKQRANIQRVVGNCLADKCKSANESEKLTKLDIIVITELF